MKRTTESVTIVPDTFAKAGEALKRLNEGQAPDLLPCNDLIPVMKAVREKAIFESLDAADQERLRAAAGAVNARYGRNDSMLLNFFSEAFGALRRPETTEEARRERVGAFLINVASA